MNKCHFPDRIWSERIYLKKHELSLAELMFNSVDEDRERLLRFLPWVKAVQSIQDEADYIQLSHVKWDHHELYDYGIFRKEDDQFMGNVGIHTISWPNDRLELGYWILGRFEGQGFMSEAVRALTNQAFEIGFNRIEIRCDTVNLKSAKVPKALGFHIEAKLRQNSKNHTGQLRDTLVFARLRSQGLVTEPKRAKPKRPDFIKHYAEIQEPDDSHYPDSDELLSIGSPFAKTFGLTRLGIHHEVLPPGRRTSWPHAESEEEEFVYVIEGHPDVWIDGNLHPLQPGDGVGFKPGTGICHTFLNNTGVDVRLLVVGERRKTNRCFYALDPKGNERAKLEGWLWENPPRSTLGDHNGLPDHSLIQPTLLTSRLTLDPINESHSAELVELLADPELHIYVPSSPPNLDEQRKKCAQWAKRRSKDGLEVWLNWLARDRASGIPVGHFQAGFKKDEPAAIGYVVAKSFHNQGLATEALTAVFDHLRQNHKIREIKAWSDTRNLGSHRVAQKLGMVQVETIKNADVIRGEPSDEYVFSKVFK